MSMRRRLPGLRMIGGINRALRSISGSLTQAGGSPALLMSVRTDGVVQWSAGISGPFEVWNRGRSDDHAANYWVRFTKVTGDNVDIGTMNTWLQITTNWSFGYSKSSGTQTWTGTFTIEIASDAGGSTIVASTAVGGITLTLTRT